MDADKKRIWIRGQFVEVTDEVYRAYMQGDRKMRYFENDLKTERFVLGKEGQVVQIIPSREDSLDRLVDENAQQFSDEQESVESVVLHKLEVDRLHTALSLLTPEERALIQGLYYADLGRGIGSEQEGYRPVLIIQNDTGNKHSPTVIVAAISSKVYAKAKLPTHYLLKAKNGLELPSLVLMEQLRTIDKRRLETYIGHLEEPHIRRLNRALAVSVGLIEETPKNLIMCLCPACANNFYGTGSYYLRRVHPERVEKDICTYCGQRPGFDYEVVKRRP